MNEQPKRRFGLGDRVGVRAEDPPAHTRAPRYVRGHVGEVIAVRRAYPAPDDVVAGLRPAPAEPVYAVRFAAADLWGDGDHTVTVDLWDRYLDSVGA